MKIKSILFFILIECYIGSNVFAGWIVDELEGRNSKNHDKCCAAINKPKKSWIVDAIEEKNNSTSHRDGSRV